MLAKINISKYGNSYKIIWQKSEHSITEDSDTENDTFIFDEKEKDENKILNQIKLDNNIVRAKSKITEYALCNNWEYFFTLTLNENKQDRYDLEKYVKDLGNWIQNYNKKYNTSLKYILIPEIHPKKGVGWHMHGLFSGVNPDSLIINKYGYLDMPYYQKRFGWISISKIRDKYRIAHYISKYIKKDIIQRSEDLNKHLFYSSKGLKTSEKVFSGTLDIPITYLQAMYNNDYCAMMWTEKLEIPDFIIKGADSFQCSKLQQLLQC